MKRAVFLFVRRLETVVLCEGVRVPEGHQDLGVEAFGGADHEENVAERRIRVDERPGHKCNKDGIAQQRQLRFDPVTWRCCASESRSIPGP